MGPIVSRLSTSIANLTSKELSMLTNVRMLNVSQDVLAVQATRVFPLAEYAAGGAVYGAPSVPSYSLPLGQDWVILNDEKKAAAGTKRLKNLGQAVGGPELSLCLNAGEGGAVSLASCVCGDSAAGTSGLDWIVTEAPAPPPAPPRPEPHGLGQVRTSDCSSASEWHYTPHGDTTTGGGSLAVVGSGGGKQLLLTDQVGTRLFCAILD